MSKTPQKTTKKPAKAQKPKAKAPVTKTAPKPPAKMGRPTVMTPAVLAKVERAFCTGASIGEAAAYADISDSVLHRYLAAHPEFKQRIEGLKGRPRLLAKLNVLDELEKGNLTVSWEVLERGNVDGYQKPQEAPKGGGVQVNVVAPGETPEGRAAIQVMREILSGRHISLPE